MLPLAKLSCQQDWLGTSVYRTSSVENDSSKVILFKVLSYIPAWSIVVNTQKTWPEWPEIPTGDSDSVKTNTQSINRLCLPTWPFFCQLYCHWSVLSQACKMDPINQPFGSEYKRTCFITPIVPVHNIPGMLLLFSSLGLSIDDFANCHINLYHR